MKNNESQNQHVMYSFINESCIDMSYNNNDDIYEATEKNKIYGVDLLEEDEAESGAPFEFDPRLTEDQACALKQAMWMASDIWFAKDADTKAAFTEQMVLETIDMAIMWDGEYPGFSLANTDDSKEFSSVLVSDVIKSLAKKYELVKKE